MLLIISWKIKSSINHLNFCVLHFIDQFISVLFQISQCSNIFRRWICFSSIQMSIRIKYPPEYKTILDVNTCSLAFILLLAVVGTQTLENIFLDSRILLFPSATHNITNVNNLVLCKIPFDECRCSVLSNKSDKSIKCITDTQAMAGHILPLLLYVLQLYFIYKLVSITGKYSYILTDIFWIIVLFIFVVIAIDVQGSSCLHLYTDIVVSFTGYLVGCFVLLLWAYSFSPDSPCRRRDISRSEILALPYHEREMPVIITLF